MANGPGPLMTRWLTAMVVLPAVLALIWMPVLGWGLTLFIALIAGVGLHEYFTMVKAKNIACHDLTGLIAGLAIVFCAHFGDATYVNTTLVAAIVVLAFLHVINPPPSIAGITASIFGTIYVGWFPAHILLLHRIEGIGPGLVMTLLVAVVLTDTAAYYAGKQFGRRPLSPLISPNKTWEGALGGMAATVLAMALLFLLRNTLDWTALPGWSLARYAVTGVAVSFGAQVGDLVASILKRDAGVKDSGRLFPGHGGALDRCDGFLFGAPVLYYMAVY